MDNTIYNLTAAQVGNFENTAVISNNVANANTQGYKADTMMFSQYLTKDINDENTMPNDISTVVDSKEGALKITGRQLDFALSGDVFFTVQTPLGVRYTRNGIFSLNNQYQLVTSEGYNVLTQGGDVITFSDTDNDIMAIADGGLLARENGSANYQERGKLGIATFDDLKMLRKAGDNNFTVEDGIVPQIPNSSSYKVIQGAIEESNVVPITEITKLIEIQRRTENASSMISGVYGVHKEAYRTIAKQQ